MLLWCPTCGRGFPSGSVRPESGTAICAEHGEVRPRMGHPIADGITAESTTAGWSTVWSRDASSYQYEAIIHSSLKTRFAPFPWQGGIALAGDPIELVVVLPLLGLMYAATHAPRLLSPCVSIDDRRVRFGLRSVRLKHVGSFVVVDEGAFSSHLATAAQDVVLLNCSQRAEALFALRDELNEALFLVQRQSPLPHTRTPYRG